MGWDGSGLGNTIPAHFQNFPPLKMNFAAEGAAALAGAVGAHLEGRFEQGVRRLEDRAVTRVRNIGRHFISPRRTRRRIVTPNLRSVRRRLTFSNPNRFFNRAPIRYPRMPYRRYGRRKTYSRRSNAKKRMRFGKQHVGFPLRTSQCKRTLIENQIAVNRSSMSLSTAHQMQLATIERQDAFDQLDRRERDHVNFRGFKVCIHFRNNSSSIPVYLHVACVAPREGLAVSVTDFLRGNGGVDKNLDFSTDLNWMQTWCNGINTDLYTVMFHKRYLLHYKDRNIGDWAGKSMSNNELMWKKYIKFRRQMRYDGANNTPEANPPILLYWFDTYNRDSTVAGVTNICQVSTHAVSFWKDAGH